MAVYSQQAMVPSGYNDPVSGVGIPPAPARLFSARDCDATVRLRTSSSIVQIGGSDVGAVSWYLPANTEYVLALPANEELYGFTNQGTSATSPTYTYVSVLVIDLVP